MEHLNGVAVDKWPLFGGGRKLGFDYLIKFVLQLRKLKYLFLNKDSCELGFNKIIIFSNT